MNPVAELRVPPASVEAWNAVVNQAAEITIAHPPATLPQVCVSLSAAVLVEALGVTGAQLALRSVASELPEMIAEKRLASFDGAGHVGRA